MRQYCDSVTFAFRHILRHVRLQSLDNRRGRIVGNGHLCMSVHLKMNFTLTHLFSSSKRTHDSCKTDSCHFKSSNQPISFTITKAPKMGFLHTPAPNSNTLSPFTLHHSSSARLNHQ